MATSVREGIEKKRSGGVCKSTNKRRNVRAREAGDGRRMRRNTDEAEYGRGGERGARGESAREREMRTHAERKRAKESERE